MDNTNCSDELKKLIAKLYSVKCRGYCTPILVPQLHCCDAAEAYIQPCLLCMTP